MIDWSQLLPVLIGGGIAIAAGVVGHLIAFKLDQKKESKQLGRRKAEELVRAIYQYGAWLDEKQNCLFRQESHEEPSPMSEAEMIQRLYFPRASESLFKIRQAAIPIVSFLNQQRIEQMKDLNKWIDNWDAEEFYVAYREYLNKVDDITEELRGYIGDIES